MLHQDWQPPARRCEHPPEKSRTIRDRLYGFVSCGPIIRRVRHILYLCLVCGHTASKELIERSLDR